jgi:ferric iron reductase protein FhuF
MNDLEDYATTYRATRDAYLKAANELKLATGPYKAARVLQQEDEDLTFCFKECSANKKCCKKYKKPSKKKCKSCPKR